MDSIIESCPICGHKQRSRLHKFSRDFLARCVSCHFVYSEKIPSVADLDRAYNGYDYSNAVSTDASLNKRRNLARLLASFVKINNVLDVGCGKGEFLDCFRELGCLTYGTEYNEKLKYFAASKGHFM